MSYTVKNWVSGEVITSSDLNHIENGLSSAINEQIIDTQMLILMGF